MKDTKRLFEAMRSIAIIAIIAIIALSMTACDTGDGNNNNNGDDGNYLIKGQFANQTAGVNATFYANTADSRSARSVTQGQALTGKIEDGQIIFNLTGFYFPDSGLFTLSAGSSFLIYEIAGTVTNSVLTNTEATVKINNNSTGGDWTTIQINVTTANDVSITGGASNQQQSGLPSSMLGNWDNDGTPIVITQFGVSMIASGKTYTQIDIVEVAKVNDTNYDVIMLGVGGDSEGSVEFFYAKVRFILHNANSLELKVYPDSIVEFTESGALASVRTFDTNTGSSENFMNLTR